MKSNHGILPLDFRVSDKACSVNKDSFNEERLKFS